MLNRRQFLNRVPAIVLSGLGVAATPGRRWRSLAKRSGSVQPLGTAKNIVFVLLEGGPSHVDTFDLKTGSQTPDILGVQTLGGGLRWPAGIMPGLAERTDLFSIVRSFSAVEAVHERAVYHLLTAHRQNNALIREIPHFASMLSYKLAFERGPGDSLPAVVMIGRDPAGNGFLPVEHQGLQVGDDGSIPHLEHWFDRAEQRFSLLDRFLETGAQISDARSDHLRIQHLGRDMMEDTELQSLLRNDFEYNDDESYYLQSFRSQCMTAVRLLSANKGTRFIQLQLGGWDHHDNIYDPTNGLPALSRAFDTGFSYLIDELSARPGTTGPDTTLLDETLVVAMGEFGRTTGRLNTSAGRDHYPVVVPAIFAGGGTRPGRILGRTNNSGSMITDPGWSRNRFMGINDFLATIYSALGIDWTERFQDTPSGRVFEMVDTSITGPAHSVDELFV